MPTRENTVCFLLLFISHAPFRCFDLITVLWQLFWLFTCLHIVVKDKINDAQGKFFILVDSSVLVFLFASVSRIAYFCSVHSNTISVFSLSSSKRMKFSFLLAKDTCSYLFSVCNTYSSIKMVTLHVCFDSTVHTNVTIR